MAAEPTPAQAEARAAAKPWRLSGAVCLILGMAIIAYDVFTPPEGAGVLGLPGGLLMLAGLVLTAVSWNVRAKALKRAEGGR